MKNKNHYQNKNLKSKPKSTSQPKSKQKSKNKSKNFNPSEYLNALIELTTNTNVLKSKQKRPNQKRDLSSALTVATPAMQQTISTSKIRCKSSYSQYRKKSTTNNLKQILNLQLKNYIITEQEDSSNCIKFTSISSAKNSIPSSPSAKKTIFVPQKYQENSKKLLQNGFSKFVDYNFYATKIQRAWRSYQTYKMVRKYYKKFKKQNKSLRIQQQNSKNPKNNTINKKPLQNKFQKPSQTYELPSYQSYQNDSYDRPILYPSQQNQKQDYLQRTIKYKIRNQQSQISSLEVQKQVRVKRQDSYSSDELNLTQKLNQLKEFVQNQSLGESKNQLSIEQKPTIEMKKGRVSFQKKKGSQKIPSYELSQKSRIQEDSSTEKKNKKQNIEDQSKINPKNYQKMNKALCQKKQKNLMTEQNKSQKVLKKTSLMDQVIKKETQKYNEILSLIQNCKQKSSNQNKTQMILSQLLNRLQQHKKQLLVNKQTSIKKIEKKEKQQKLQKLKLLDSPESKQSDVSFLAFESKDIYQQFQEYDFKTNKKSDKKETKFTTNFELSQQKRKQEEKFQFSQKQIIDSQKRIQSLRKYYEILSNESQKLEHFFDQSKDQYVGTEMDFGSSSLDQSQSLKLYESKDLNEQSQNYEQVSKQSQKKLQNIFNPFGQDFQNIQNENHSVNSSQSIDSFCSQTFSEDSAQKIFEQHIKLIEIKRKKSIENLEKLIQTNKISKQLYLPKCQQIQQKYEAQNISILQKKQKYLKSLKSVKKQALRFQKDLLLQTKNQLQNKNIKGERLIKNLSGTNLGIRKSFSAESIVLKCILKQPILKSRDFKVDDYLVSEQEILLNNQQLEYVIENQKSKEQFTFTKKESKEDWFDHKQKQLSSGQNIVGTNTNEQIRSQSHEEKQESNILIEDNENDFQPISSQLLPSQKNNKNIDDIVSQSYLLKSCQDESTMIKVPSQLRQKYSEELQKLIETFLFTEIIEEIYVSDSLIKVFKPFIEDVYSFAPITDTHVMDFVRKQVPKFFPPYSELVYKANQKINPTSQEILRLVRDFQFQIDEYELILSEQVFKSFRKKIEQDYQQKIIQYKNLPINLTVISNTENVEIAQKVKQRETAKRNKVSKYMEYERDMKIMYMKAVFNCLNEFLIEEKSLATHVNTRTNISAGQLSISIKQFNAVFDKQKTGLLFTKSNQRIEKILKNKCMLPVFKNYKEVGMFQQQLLRMIRLQFQETEYKWVTYMDEVLQIWNEIANNIVTDLMKEAVFQLIIFR